MSHHTMMFLPKRNGGHNDASRQSRSMGLVNQAALDAASDS